MKLLILFFIAVNLLFINSQHLRNLKLTRDVEKYKVLTQVGQQSFKQLNKGIVIDFNDLNNAQYEDKNAKLYIVVDEYDEETPDVDGKFTFEINNGKPDISNLSSIIPDSANVVKLDIFGGVYDVREQVKAVENMIAAGYDKYSGTVVIYKKSDEKISQRRYKCFVKDSEKTFGSFEIIQEDKNDASEIQKSTTNWWDKVKGYITDGTGIAKNCCEVVSLVLGIIKDIKDIKSFSSFLKIPYLSLLVILGLF